jgi:hypothetical protein
MKVQMTVEAGSKQYKSNAVISCTRAIDSVVELKLLFLQKKNHCVCFFEPDGLIDLVMII